MGARGNTGGAASRRPRLCTGTHPGWVQWVCGFGLFQHLIGSYEVLEEPGTANPMDPPWVGPRVKGSQGSPQSRNRRGHPSQGIAGATPVKESQGPPQSRNRRGHPSQGIAGVTPVKESQGSPWSRNRRGHPNQGITGIAPVEKLQGGSRCAPLAGCVRFCRPLVRRYIP